MRNLFASLFLSMLALPALTQAAEDPPGRVARLSHIEGEVSMAPAGTQEWGEAVLNRPLTSEDRLFVDRDARAELQIGSASIHLDASTEFSFIDLDDDAMTMNLTEGRATIRILRKREREDIEINTPNASIALLHPGEYHIEVGEDGETTIVKTRSGKAEVAGEGKAYTVEANEVGVFRGSDELSSDVTKLGPRTAFENWANDRARRNERSASSKYVGEDVVGYEDLDEHGHWVHEPEYGYVWRPTYVVAGWAPYRHGRWAWVSPWGWTWIDDARWGFAPFHYGRWAYANHRWCWVPGPRHVRAVYAPALVAWTGGPHVSIGVSVGSGVGWFPLAPHEVYVPGYWHTRRHIHQINVSNTIIVNNTYINNAYRGRHHGYDYRYRGRADAVTVVERDHFVRGRPVGQRLARVDERELQRWNHDARPPAIAPERDSVRAANARTPRGWDANRSTRQVVARRELPSRVSFDTERSAIEANGGRPIGRAALIDRNPKERSDVRVTRVSGREMPNGRLSESAGAAPDASARRQRLSGSSEAERRTESRRAVESMRATEGATQSGSSAAEVREPRVQRGDAQRERAQREWGRDRSVSGDSASIDSRQASPSARSERNSSDWAQQRAQRQLEQARVFEAREQASQQARQEASQRNQQARDSIRESQQAQRESVQRERESQRAPQVERRAEPQPQRQSQPRIERSAPQPRAQGGMSEGRSSTHSRGGERGMSSRER